METRRNFLKKLGLGGIVGALNFKNTFSKNNEVKIYGSDFIKQFLEEYKKGMPLEYKYEPLNELNRPFTTLLNGQLIAYFIGSEFFSIYYGKGPWDCRLGVSKNKQRVSSVEFINEGVAFKKEKGGFLFSRDYPIMSLPNSEEFFKPYEELDELIWKDLKRFKSYGELSELVREDVRRKLK